MRPIEDRSSSALTFHLIRRAVRVSLSRLKESSTRPRAPACSNSSYHLLRILAFRLRIMVPRVSLKKIVTRDTKVPLVMT